MDLLTSIRETPKDHKAAKSQVSCQPSLSDQVHIVFPLYGGTYPRQLQVCGDGEIRHASKIHSGYR